MRINYTFFHVFQFVSQTILVLSLSVLWGCTNAVPQLDLLLSAVSTERPSSITFTSPSENSIAYESLTITGTCSSGKSVLLSGSGMTNGPISVTCTSGVFSQAIVFSSGDGVKTIELSDPDLSGIKVSRNFIKETPPLEVTINQSLMQPDPTTNPSIGFDIQFSRAIDPLTFEVTDIINAGSATVGAWTLVDSGDHILFSLQTSAVTNSGSIVPTIPAGGVNDPSGFSNQASTSTDNSVTYSLPAGPRVLSVTSSNSDGTYTNGQTLHIELQFSEAVDVIGGPPPTILLAIGGPAGHIATYASGSGTSTLTFDYQIIATNYSSDLDLDSPSIILNGSTIKNGLGTEASLILPIGAGTPSLSSNKNLVIIGTPASLSITGSGNFGNVVIGSPTEMSLTVSNSASAVVPAIFSAGSTISPPFSFNGGSAFPGASSTCGTSLLPGQSCTFIVVFHPLSAGIESGSLGFAFNSGLSLQSVSYSLTGEGTLIPLSVNPVYPNFGANWNDYVQFAQFGDGPRSQASDSPGCTGTESGYYNEFGGCIHGGELKKVAIPGITSCAGLILTESLGVFRWECAIQAGIATFYTKGFAPGKGLRDLITVTGGTGTWKLNSVTVQQSATTIASSTALAWWTNPVTEAPPSDPTSVSIQSLSTSGTVYYAQTDRQYQILDITADKIALVTLGNSKIGANSYNGTGVGRCNASNGSTANGSLLALLCIDNIKHLWLEANLTGMATPWIGDTGLLAYGLNFSRIHRTIMNGFKNSSTEWILSLNSSKSNLITETELFKGSRGLYLAGSSTKNTFRKLSISSIEGASAAGGMIKIASISDANRFYDLSLTNLANSFSPNAQGINVSTNQNIFQRVNISNVQGTLAESAGVKVTGGSNIFVQVGAFGSRKTGLWLAGGAASNIFSNYTASNHVSHGIYASGSNNWGNYFQSVAIVNVGNYAVEVTDTLGSSNVFNSILATDVPSGFDLLDQNWASWEPLGYFTTTAAGNSACSGSVFCASAPNRQALGISTLTDAFVGKVGGVNGQDTSNGVEDAAGLASFLALVSSPQEWFNFDHWLRGWGRSHLEAFPSGSHQGYCASGDSCQLWDWRVKAGRELHNKSRDGLTENTAFTPGAACPSAVDGSARYTTRGAFTFLHNAVEIDGDFIGNDNGLCESNEVCIYAPNIGAYQGEGALTEACIFAGGTVSGVTMKSYSVTGK